MHRPSRPTAVTLLAILAIPGLVLLAYWPSFRLFIGTDLGVYWEVSRRLFEEGRLSLGGNYWDHKPPAVYIALLPWHRFTTPHAEFLGLKIGALAVYACSFTLVAIGLVRAAADRMPSRIFCVCGIVAVAAVLSLDSRLDPVQNGLPSVGALCFEGAGLAFLAAATLARRRFLSAALAGVLLATAPFWRPTSAIGGFVLACAFGAAPLFGLARGRLPAWAAPVLIATVAAAVTVGAWLSTIAALGTPLSDFAATVVEFNVRYGSYFRGITPVGEFLRQDETAYELLRAAALVLAVMVCGGATRGDGAGRSGSGKVVVIAAAYALLAVLAAVQSRKIQSFYVFQFALPALFAASFAIARASARLDMVFRWLALAAWASCGLMVWPSLAYVWPVARANEFASNRRMQTGAIVERLAELSKDSERRPRLWICGNRAPLYQAAALVGIDRYDWTVFDTAIYAINDDGFDGWRAGFESDPPEFVVRLGNAQNTPWEPPEKVSPRIEAVNEVLNTRYEIIETPAGEQSTWPYGYVFTVYRLKVH